MFFPYKIKSIRDFDKVLEVGPGANPYHRSDILLEKKFDSYSEWEAQCGKQTPNSRGKQTVFYEGETFPFQDKEFDYVICSHVLEHIEDIDFFVREVNRVSKRGYFEFPLVYYDFIYDIPEHTVFLFYENNIIKWMPKGETAINEFKNIQKFLKKTLDLQYFSLVDDLKQYMFQGFEWVGEIKTEKVNSVNDLCWNVDLLNIPLKELPKLNTLPKSNREKIKGKLISLINRIL